MESKTGLKFSYFLVIFFSVTCKNVYSQARARWQQANTGPVCFGARFSHFGSFNLPSRGRLAAIKLVHLYGYVSCDTGQAKHWSFWGCGKHSSVTEHVNVVITTSPGNNRIFPASHFIDHTAGLWAKVPGYNSVSPELVLSRFFRPYPVQSGEQLRLWYGEDLRGFTEDDNGGTVCCDVYALYVA